MAGHLFRVPGLFYFQMKSKYLPHEFKVVCVRECVATETIDTPELAVKYWRDNIPQAPWFDQTKEALVVLVLNTRRRILGHNLVALGSLDICPVTPLHVFRPAIVQSAASLILAHNHPSGQADPSEADIKVTRDLVRAGQLLKIEITDHIIIGAQTHKSLRELGYLT
jgi:DNA repair protein RadC